MVRRKESMGYAEFVRGKYEIHDLLYIKQLLENLTMSEIAYLRTTPFETIWKNLWSVYMHPREYTEACEKFTAVQHILFTVEPLYDELEWGFPKGRRFKDENTYQCAEREFMEETNIARNKYTLIDRVVFTETFKGTNGTAYTHLYYVGFLTEPITAEEEFSISQQKEISAIGWKTFSECIAYIRPHQTSREVLLNDIMEFVETVEIL